jgi:hypothetical protein
MRQQDNLPIRLAHEAIDPRAQQIAIAIGLATKRQQRRAQSLDRLA